MELLGDIAGIYALLQSFIGILIFEISKISFHMSLMKKIFLVKSKNKNHIFEEKMKMEGRTQEMHYE